MTESCPECGTTLEDSRCPQCQAPDAESPWNEIEAGWELDEEEEGAAASTGQADAPGPRPRRTRAKRKKKARGPVAAPQQPTGAPETKRGKRPPKPQQEATAKTRPPRPRPWLAPLLVFLVALAAFVLVLIAAAD